MPTILRLLDTDVMIDIQKGKPSALAWFSTQSISEVGIPGFVAMELYQAARNLREARSADAITRPLTLVWPSAAACGRTLTDFRALHLSHSLGLPDALIGTTAREIGAILCTFNLKHYKAVPGLFTEQPYTR